MTLRFEDLNKHLNSLEIGQEMFQLIKELYPICRSMTGNGIRDTLHLIQRHVSLDIHEVPSGTNVFDWTVPKEWNIRDAYIKDEKGEKIVDFKKSNLHVVSYSVPVNKKMSLTELKQHIFTLPDHPDWIPYRTAYYEESWGFCLAHKQLLELTDGEYEVYIDSSLNNGHLTYGEYYIRGDEMDEVLISCHTCHPSLCNDNLSGIALTTFLAKYLSHLSLRYSYRFLFIPATIGSITWLCLNEPLVSRIKHGLVVACVGDSGNITYKKSRQGSAEIDGAISHVLQHSQSSYSIIDFYPYGYDDRQYCSPAFNLPIGCLMRTQHGHFPEYHTSEDNLEFVKIPCLADSFTKCLSALYIIENNKRYINLNPKCEPQLGKRGLYHSMGIPRQDMDAQIALLWVLNLSDGKHNLLDIAEKSGLSFYPIQKATDSLLRCNLLKEA